MPRTSTPRPPPDLLVEKPRIEFVCDTEVIR
jgi:hypothetical protein